MSVAEMKIEVITKIASIENETILKEVLALLSEGNYSKDAPTSLSHFYNDIKNQYGDVLQKLAE